MSMKNSSDTMGNRTRDFPVCSAVPQPTASPRAPNFLNYLRIIIIIIISMANNEQYLANNCLDHMRIRITERPFYRPLYTVTEVLVDFDIHILSTSLARLFGK
jgi:hypothetical protein